MDFQAKFPIQIKHPRENKNCLKKNQILKIYITIFKKLLENFLP